MAAVEIPSSTFTLDLDSLKDLTNFEIITILNDSMSGGDMSKFGWEDAVTYSQFMPSDTQYPKPVNFVGMDLPLTQTTTQGTYLDLDSAMQCDAPSYTNVTPVSTSQVTEVSRVEQQGEVSTSYTTLSPLTSTKLTPLASTPQLTDLPSPQDNEFQTLSSPVAHYLTLDAYNQHYQHQLAPTASTSWAGTPDLSEGLTNTSSLSDMESCTGSTSSFLGSPGPTSPAPQGRCHSRSSTQGSGSSRGISEPILSLPGPSGVRRRSTDSTSTQRKAPAPRKRKPKEKKKKLYERELPFEDPKLEKKRIDAINSKKNRDKKKKSMDELRKMVEDAIKERDELKKELEKLRLKEYELRSKIQANDTSNTANPIMLQMPTVH